MPSKKKPIKKSPAKKSAPKVKLIEGKLSHKFLTRLEPKEGEVLDQLKKHFKQKTSNGTIVNLINAYYPLMERKYNLEKELNEAKQQMNKQANILFGLKDNFKALNELKLVDISFNDDDDVCEVCGDPLVNGQCADCDL